MEDLETVLPGGVQVSTIEPIRDKDGHITLAAARRWAPRPRRRSGAESGALQALPRSLASSVKTPRPAAVPNQRLEPVSASNRFNFDLLAEYNPPSPRKPNRLANLKKALAATGEVAEEPPRTSAAQIPGSFSGTSGRPTPARPHKSQSNPAPEVRNEQRQSPSLLRERLKSPLTWHYAGFAVLLVLVIGLAVRLGMDWAATNSRSADALAGKQVELKALDLETAPLRGLDKRVEKLAHRC